MLKKSELEAATARVERRIAEHEAATEAAPDAPVQTQTALEPKDGGSVGDHERQREETD